jgi:hypothetical protein
MRAVSGHGRLSHQSGPRPPPRAPDFASSPSSASHFTRRCLTSRSRRKSSGEPDADRASFRCSGTRPRARRRCSSSRNAIASRRASSALSLPHARPRRAYAPRSLRRAVWRSCVSSRAGVWRRSSETPAPSRGAEAPGPRCEARGTSASSSGRGWSGVVVAVKVGTIGRSGTAMGWGCGLLSRVIVSTGGRRGLGSRL